MKASPLQQLKERFETKDGLIRAVQALAGGDLALQRLSDKGLGCVSNRKLLRLHHLLSQVKDGFGGRAQLLDALCKAENRGQDSAFRARLEALPLPRLLDRQRTLQKRSRQAAAAGGASNP